MMIDFTPEERAQLLELGARLYLDQCVYKLEADYIVDATPTASNVHHNCYRVPVQLRDLNQIVRSWGFVPDTKFRTHQNWKKAGRSTLQTSSQGTNSIIDVIGHHPE